MLEMSVVCEVCGDVGYKDLLLHCNRCKYATRHRYCLDAVIYDTSLVEWLCSGCLLKHNEVTKSLEDVSNQRQLSNTQSGSFIINEPNVKKAEVTKGLWSWGNRSRKARRDCMDGSAKHFLSGDAFNSSEMFMGGMSHRNDSEKEGEGENEHLIGALEIFYGSSHSALDHASKIEEHINLQKPMGGLKPTLNSMKWPNHLKEKDSCFSSSKYVERSIPPGKKADLFSLINHVERSHPLIVDDSSYTLARVEQADGSSPTLASVGKSHPKPKSVLESIFPAMHSNPMQRSDLKSGNVGFLNTSKECLDSRSKIAEPSSPSNELEDSIVEKDSAERTKCLVDEEIITPILENRKGSNPSMAKEFLVSNLDNSDEANRRSDELLLSTKDNKMRGQMSGEVHHSCDDPSEIVNSWKVHESANSKPALEGDQDGRNLQCNAGKASFPPVKKVVCRQVSQVEGVNGETLSSKHVSPCKLTKGNSKKRPNQSNSHTPNDYKYQKAKVIKKNKNVDAAQSKSGRPAASLKDNQNMSETDDGNNNKVIEYSKLGKDKKMDKPWLGNKASNDLQKRGMVASVLQPSSLHKNSLDKSMPCSENMDLVLKESSCPLNNPRSKCARRLLTEVDKMEPSRQFDHTYSCALLEISSKTEEVHEVNDTELEHSEAAQSFKNGKPKKRRRLLLPYEDDENAEDTKVEDSHPRSFNDDGQVKKHRRYVENGVKNQRRYVENCEVALQLGNLNRRSFKDHTPVKMQRSTEANEDENAVVGDLNAGCAQNDNSQLASQTAVTDHCGLSRTPLISGYICVQPIDKPCWTGIMKIGRDYISLAAHVSTKACKKVWELSRFLPQIMKVTELSTLKAWPKRWEASKPTADSIGLYFFSDTMRPNKELDQLVKYVADCGIVLKTVVGFAKLLIFSSVVLAEEYQVFKGKHYLWGVFMRMKDRRRRSAPAKQDCTANVAEEEQVQEQQDKRQCDTLDQEMPAVEHLVHSEYQPLLDANQDVGKGALSGNGPHSAEMNSPRVQSNCFQLVPKERKENAQEFTCLPGSNASLLVEPYQNSRHALVSASISPADRRQPCSNSEAPPPKLFGFVVARTPRSAQLIQEMENEGALLFAVQ